MQEKNKEKMLTIDKRNYQVGEKQKENGEN